MGRGDLSDICFTERYAGVDVTEWESAFTFSCTNCSVIRFASASPVCGLFTDYAVKHDDFYLGKADENIFIV